MPPRGSCASFHKFFVIREWTATVEITQPFYAGIYPVTQEQYQRIMGQNPSHFSSTGGGSSNVNGMDTRPFPVENVSWEDAIEFCRRLSELPGEKENEHLYRLPTEAEWEYICRGGPFFKKPSPPFHFGNSLSSTQANFDGRNPYGGAATGAYLQRTTKVGSYPPNPLGLYDLHGNVWEWCADWYDADYYKRSPKQDPQGPENSEHRVLRGGSWGNNGWYCRAACRCDFAPAVATASSVSALFSLPARGLSTTAPLANTYVAGPTRLGGVCDGIPSRCGFAPAAKPTSAGSPPHPTAACRADVRAAPLPRAPSSAALFPPNRRFCSPRNHRARRDRAV